MLFSLKKKKKRKGQDMGVVYFLIVHVVFSFKEKKTLLFGEDNLMQTV